MRTTIGSLPVDLVRAEAARFQRPLLFLHGLWTDASIWAPMAGYLSHRGWESWAPTLHADPPQAAYEMVVDAARTVLPALPGAPIIVAHDIGIVAALALAAGLERPAVVALAPLTSSVDGGRLGALGLPRFWRARFGGDLVEPPSGALGRQSVGRAGALTLRPDSGPIFRALLGRTLRLPSVSAMPGLVLGGAEDPIAPPAALDALAARQSWDRVVRPGSAHFPMLEPGWEQLSDDVHRWIVRALGEEILAWLDDEEDP